MNTQWQSISLILVALASAPAAGAATTWQQNRLIPLTKVTVGPWDNYKAAVALDDNVLYFTRALNQIPNVYRQDLRSNEANVFIGADGDAKDLVMDASGKTMAFTYFGRDAQGDVCLLKLPEKNIDCLTDHLSVDESPFWIDAGHLGFLSRRSAQFEWQLVSYDLTTHERQTLHQGLISAPVASPDGRYILFNQAEADGGTRVRIFDRQTDELTTPVRFDLSGITGFMAFSRDGSTLYFNHYLSDTNLDQVIDGNDHSVTFRVPFAQWLSAKVPLLPEQLTPVSSNCKFPATTEKHLYLTCAFEGTLDIYRLPLTGTVPTAWDETQLWEAHRTARSHEARLLILNTLRYRYRRTGPEMLERLLSNHLEIGELSAAVYYVAQLTDYYQQSGNTSLTRFYQTLGQLLQIKSAKQRVPVGLVTARFQRAVTDTRERIHSSVSGPRLIQLVDGYLDYELENFDEALARLAHIDLSQPMLPLERYLAFELYRQLLETKQPGRLLEYYPLMFNEASLSLEARLYYAFQYLERLNQTQTDIAIRIDAIAHHLTKAADPKVAELFRGEVASLRLAVASNERKQGALFKELTTLLKNNRDDLLVRKALHTRAIQILGEAEKFHYMELLSRNWLIITHVSEMEFYNVAEQYSVITMDKAYGMLSQGELARAYSTFYSAIRQTNDLEAHYQFVTLGLNPSLDKRENLDRSYQILEQDNVLGQNRKYVAALRLLIESGETDKPSTTTLDKALNLLKESDSRGLNPSLRELLLGYIYHRKLHLSQDGYSYNKALFQKAHYHYMMAFDLARDNGRVLASVWQNLAMLHFDVRNYALSAAFFAQRTKVPFVTPADEALTRLAYARALFYSNDLNNAEQQAEAALAIARQNTSLGVTPFLEKTAFYAMQAGSYERAASYFEELLGDPVELPDLNRAKALLGYGYVLRQLNRKEEASERLRELLDASNQLRAEPASPTGLLSFQPQRLQLLAYGLLAEVTDETGEEVRFRRERTRLLTDMSGRSEDFAYEESSRLSFLIKDYHHLAVAYERLGQFDQMANAMDQALRASVDWTKTTDDDMGPVVYRTLVNYLSLGLSHDDVFSTRKQTQLIETCERTISAFSKHTYRSPVIVAQQAKLTVLWKAYRNKVLGLETDQRLEAVLKTDEVQRLKNTQPEAYGELQAIVAGLNNL